MREIEFRGKSKFKNTWVYGKLLNHKRIITQSDDETEEMPCFDMCDYQEEVFENTIGQYTGKKDKNGTKIFEGDIVKYIRKNMYAPTTSFHNQDLISLHKIYWNEEKHQFCQKHYTLPELKCIGGGNITFEDERADENIIEVIGNIYDNPELLGEEV